MTPGSRCMRGNTCDCRMLWTYRWAVIVSRINNRCGLVLKSIESHTITTAVRAVCRCKEKAGLRRTLQGIHFQKRLSSLLRLNLESLLKMTWFHSAADQFPRVCGTNPKGGVDGWESRAAYVLGVKGSSRVGRQGQHTCWASRAVHVLSVKGSTPLFKMNFSQTPSYGSRRHRGP
ncbi:hypothetical protein TNCV_1733451 [Trichonephila clavipes]|nr:hypothetical protein TNCV_1733451 [Trichonephila clavipes]